MKAIYYTSSHSRGIVCPACKERKQGYPIIRHGMCVDCLREYAPDIYESEYITRKELGLEDTRMGHEGETVDELVEIQKTISHIAAEQQKILRNQNRLYEALMILSGYIMWSFRSAPEGETKLKGLELEQ
jgi:hypothetical protein